MGFLTKKKEESKPEPVAEKKVVENKVKESVPEAESKLRIVSEFAYIDVKLENMNNKIDQMIGYLPDLNKYVKEVADSVTLLNEKVEKAMKE